MQDIEIDMNEMLITLTSDIVAAHVSNNNVALEDVPSLISNVYGALAVLRPYRKKGRNRPSRYALR
jgi:predicted transcriptional regulator